MEAEPGFFRRQVGQFRFFRVLQGTMMDLFTGRRKPPQPNNGPQDLRNGKIAASFRIIPFRIATAVEGWEPGI